MQRSNAKRVEEADHSARLVAPTPRTGKQRNPACSPTIDHRERF